MDPSSFKKCVTCLLNGHSWTTVSRFEQSSRQPECILQSEQVKDNFDRISAFSKCEELTSVSGNMNNPYCVGLDGDNSLVISNVDEPESIPSG